MENRVKPPTSMDDFKGKPPRVSASKEGIDEADLEATRAMLQQYTQDDGFHCPRCGVVIVDPEEAIYHLAEEINKALDHLGKRPE